MTNIAVKVGQVWQDKDKRRNTRIEIIAVVESATGLPAKAVGLVVGTEEERDYAIERLQKRWLLVEEKAVETINETHPGLAQLDKELEALLAPEQVYGTREAYLQAAVKLLDERVFTPEEIEVPEVRVSVGWPGGRGKKTGVIGQCFATKTVGDKVAAVFISPVLENPYEVVETLAHELIHAIDDCESGHKKNFVKIGKQIGFMAPWKSTPAGDELKAKIETIAEDLGVYPHSAISAADRPTVQKTYMVKIVPSEDCADCDPDYKLRMTQKWLEEAGAPLCPHGVEMVAEEK